MVISCLQTNVNNGERQWRTLTMERETFSVHMVSFNDIYNGTIIAILL